MLISDIRSFDKVSIKPNINKESLIKFMCQKFTESDKFINKKLAEDICFNSSDQAFQVVKVLRAVKTRTEYAILKVLNAPYRNAEIKIQTRFLQLTQRKPKHKITSIFV